jgi:hypothetical protein
MSAPLLIFIFLLIINCAACIRCTDIARKIVKKLKVVDPDEWKRITWLFGIMINPFRFQKFLKEPTTSDPYIKECIIECKRALRFAWIMFFVFIFIITIIAFSV